MSGLNLIQSVDTLMVLLKEVFESQKKSADDNKNANYPVGK